jgi:hypothetical protein
VVGDGDLQVMDGLPRTAVADELCLNNELNASAGALS